MANDARRWISALRTSHDRLAGLVGRLSPEQVAGPSYCSEWTVAQVLSHLGSGAEIGLANLEAALAGGPAPARDVYQAIWDRWNAKSPAEMAADALVSDERHVSRVEGLSDDELGSVTMDFMGMTLDASAIVGLRLGEHAVHTWDVETTLEPAAAIPEGVAELVLGVLPPRAGRLARGDKPEAAPVDLAVATTGPARSYTLRIGDEVSLSAEPAGDAKGQVSLPAEALIRLLYGRLDAGHTPAGTLVDGPVSLDELRALFPGF